MSKGWTFQSLIDDKMKVTAHCHNPACHHNQELDLAKRRDRLGSDAPAMEWDIRPKLLCKKCEGNKVGLIYTPDTSPNAYAKAKDGAPEVAARSRADERLIKGQCRSPLPRSHLTERPAAVDEIVAQQSRPDDECAGRAERLAACVECDDVP
ncbi:hypothetical protein JQK88_16520 [Mesorhizobium caraganae]|uniref:hypothetical protein n=1 Tax=Mesorhizobium caraganae TaxID=483206 RepID=UPI00193A1FBD|nr:hypothetical protein [Mesorhizobium caraganae]MBM2712810.1 hypothetical protein [Mesorhizobium caraganae]